MFFLQLISVLVAIAGAVGFLIAGVFWVMPSRRHRAKRVQVLSTVSLVVGVVVFVSLISMDMSNRAASAGFNSSDDMKTAAKEGITDGKTWYDLLAQRKHAEEQKKNAEREACRADFECWGRDRRIDAEVRCKSAIERQAHYEHKWTDGWAEPMFSKFGWKDEKAGVMTYYGDRLKFQNGFGAWANMIYTCDYDIEADKALAVDVAEGHL